MNLVHDHKGCPLDGRLCTRLPLDPARDYCLSDGAVRVLFDGESESRIVPADTLRGVSE